MRMMRRIELAHSRAVGYRVEIALLVCFLAVVVATIYQCSASANRKAQDWASRYVETKKLQTEAPLTSGTDVRSTIVPDSLRSKVISRAWREFMVRRADADSALRTVDVVRDREVYLVLFGWDFARAARLGGDCILVLSCSTLEFLDLVCYA